MARVRVLLVALVLIGAGAVGVSRASAAAWPTARQFVLVAPPPPLTLGPPPSSVAEDTDGSLLVLVYWPVLQPSLGTVTEFPRTRLVRVGLNGSQAFVPPFGHVEPGSSDTRINVDDEILPLPDGSILFTVYAAIDRRLPNGTIVRFAGTGRFDERPSGDGGPATAADIGFAHGLSRFPDGSIVFADGSRIRRVAPDGIITTIAGSDEFGFSGDGGPATAARLSGPSDVLAMPDGGFLIADAGNGRVRRVSADGVISTIAGTDKANVFVSSGDGGPASAAALALPAHLARLPDGSLLIGERQRIRRVSPDGTISTIYRVPEGNGNRLGDFAGRYGLSIEAMDATREGGIAVIVAGYRLRALYLAPRRTGRTLVALRGVRVSQRGVAVTVDTTAAGRLRLEVRRRGTLVARASRHVRPGRRSIRLARRLAAAYHDVRVTLRADRGGGYTDGLRVFTSATLPKRLVIRALGDSIRACTRIDRRRVDCEVHDAEDEDNGRPCLHMNAYRLFPSGVLFTRSYGGACHDRPIPFDRTPRWTGRWFAWPAPAV